MVASSPISCDSIGSDACDFLLLQQIVRRLLQVHSREVSAFALVVRSDTGQSEQRTVASLAALSSVASGSDPRSTRRGYRSAERKRLNLNSSLRRSVLSAALAVGL